MALVIFSGRCAFHMRMWLGLIVLAMILIVYAHVPCKVTVYGVYPLSSMGLASISKNLTPSVMQKNSPQNLLKILESWMSNVRSIRIAHDYPRHASLYVSAAHGCALINNLSVLTVDGHVAPLDQYSAEYVSQLPRISMPEVALTGEECASCSTWLTAVPSEIIEQYAIVWYAKSHIELIRDDVTYIVWNQTVFSDEVVRALDRVAEHCRVSSKTKAGQKIEWIVDVRVPHYCIAMPKPRRIL